MLKCILCVGAPACGKSTWAKSEVAKDPTNWVRINNDDIRSMTNGSVYSADYEKLITDTRNFLIRQAFQRDKNVIIDNVNANKRHWDDTCKLAKEANKDIQILEKFFYEDLEVLLERDSKREGKARVGETVVKKWYKELGGKQFAFYRPKIEIFTKRNKSADRIIEPMVQDESKQKAIICDLDGTLCYIGDRSPYDAKDCDIIDYPNPAVIETVKLYFKAGYDIIFCSGREDKFEPETRRFIEKYCLIDNEQDHKDHDWVPVIKPIEYQLFMRKSNDLRADNIIKEEIFNDKIKDNYFIRCVLDDRNKVVAYWRSIGLTCFQVQDGDF